MVSLLVQRIVAVAESLLSRPVRTGVLVLSLVALVTTYAAMCFVYVFVFGGTEWPAGMLFGAVARAMDGGHYYDGAGSMLGPTWPYFPFSVLVTHAAATLGAPLVLVPPILGGLSAFLLPFVSAAFARSLGAKWLPSLIASFVLYGLLLPHYHSFSLIAAGFFPDACIPIFALLSCIAVNKMEISGPRRSTLVAFGLALFAGGLSKQVGVAAFISSGVYLAILSPMPKTTRWRAIGVATAAAVAVLGVLLVIPHCLEVTVAVMSHHPKDWKRTSVIWEFLFNKHLPVVLLSFLAFSAAASADRKVGRRIVHFSMTLAIVVVVQVMSTVKDGGGGEGIGQNYNMEMVISLAIPLAAWAWATLLHRQSSWAGAGVLVVASLFCVRGLRESHEQIWSRRAKTMQAQQSLSREFARCGKDGRDVFTVAPDFYALNMVGCRLATPSEAVWHFSSADPNVKDPRWLSGVERAIREQRYALISPAWGTSLSDEVRRRLGADIAENYTSTTGTTCLIPKGHR